MERINRRNLGLREKTRGGKKGEEDARGQPPSQSHSQPRSKKERKIYRIKKGKKPRGKT